MFRLLFVLSLVYILGSLGSSQNNSTNKVSFGLTALFGVLIQFFINKIAARVFVKTKIELKVLTGS